MEATHTDARETEVDHDDETPVNQVHFTDDGRQFIVKECVLCGETHRHGSCDPAVAEGGRSHRVEHCHGISHSGGYYLELADDAEPPQRWAGWLERETGVDVTEVDV
jgi:hypothetical protein